MDGKFIADKYFSVTPAGVVEWIARPRSLVLNLTAAQVINPSLPALCCLHEGCLKGKSAVYTLIKCTLLMVEKADVVPDVTLRLTMHKQVGVQVREPP